MRPRLLACLRAASIFAALFPLRSEPAPGDPPTVAMTFAEFMKEVADSNLDYAAQRYNVPIAQAQFAIARVFLPNPQLQLGYGEDVTPGRARSDRESTVTDGGFTQTIQLGGKRGARMDAAQHSLLAASASLDDFFRNLRSTAASSFIDACAKRMIADRMRASAAAFERVVQISAERLKVGDVGEVDATQARVDALQFRSQYLSAESDAEAAVIALSQLLGRNGAYRTILPQSNLDFPEKKYELSRLMAEALEKRPDVTAAREARDAAAASVRLAKANRIPDIGVGLTYTQTGASNNVVAPYERTDTLAAALSFELPVFSRYQHELEIARYAEHQADKQYDSAMLKVQIDVRQAFAAYQLAVQQIGQFRDRGALRDAESVLRARSFSYQHGAASLLDLLQAQRDFNDVTLNYYNALSAHAKARVALEQAVGVWEVDF